MAPKVCVPADFGRHHIGAPSHGNLTFNLQEELQIKANSIILSLNSPVIDELTTNLHLTSLEAEDFSREAVDCFIEASYTGEVEALNLGNFRDVNKMSAVFKVNWLVDRCQKFYISYLDRLSDESSHSDLLFAVEEAVYLMSALKKGDFLHLVVKKMNRISNVRRDGFVNQYLSDLSAVSLLQIDVCIAIVDTDVHVLAELLIHHLEKGEKVGSDENSRYLFKKLDLTSCDKVRPDILDKLFAVVEGMDGIQKDDFKIVLGKLQQNFTENRTATMAMGKLVTVEMMSIEPYMALCNLENVIDMLVDNEMVDNLYKLIDGIWLRAFISDDDTLNESVIEKLVRIKHQKGWNDIDYEYASRLYTGMCSAPKFVELLKNCGKLVSKRSTKSHASSKDYSGSEFIREVFQRDNILPFRLEKPEFVDAQFVIYTSAVKELNPDTFSIKWGAFSECHRNNLPNLHVAVERWMDGEWSNLFPITWLGKPTCEPTRTSWAWGCIHYNLESKNTFRKLARGKDKIVFRRTCINILDGNRYRFVVFEV